MAYTLDWRGKTVRVTWHGVVRAGNVGHAADRIAGDRRFDSLRCVLHDFRDCDGVVFDVESVEMIAAIDSSAIRTNPNLQVVAVTNRDDVRAAFSAYEAAVDGRLRVRVLATMEEALAMDFS